MSKIYFNGQLYNNMKGEKYIVEAVQVKDTSLDKTQSEINEEQKALTDLLPTTSATTSDKVATLVKNADGTGLGVKLSDNFSVGDDGTIGVNVDNLNIDLTDYAKTADVDAAMDEKFGYTAVAKGASSAAIYFYKSYAAAAADSTDTLDKTNLPVASTTQAGIITAEDKTKLDNIESTYAKSADVTTEIASAIKTYNDSTGVALNNAIGTKSTVSVSQGTATSGTLVGTVTVDGTAVELYAPTAESPTFESIDALISDTYSTKIYVNNTVANYVNTTLSKYLLTETASNTYVKKTDLLENGLVKSSVLPSYVDDVIEGTYVSTTVFNDTDGNAITAESGKIYVDTTTNITYRWSGSQYVAIGSDLALGETSSTAFAGDRGKTLETWKATGTSADETSGRQKLTFSNGLLTDATADTDLDNLISYYQAATSTQNTRFIKANVDHGLLTSFQDVAISDITDLRGDITSVASMPLVYVGITGEYSAAYANSTTFTTFDPSKYYINTSTYPVVCCMNSNAGNISDTTSCYTDNFWLPTLKVGDILVTNRGTVYMVTKELDGTSPVQVANISQLRTSASTVSLTSEEYDSLDDVDENTIYVVKDTE